MKTYFGCDGAPQTPEGQPTSWKLGPADDVRVELHTCPAKYLEGVDDIWHLIRSGSMADWKLSITEQDESAPRWVDAFAVACRECRDASYERARAGEKAGG